MGCTALQSVSIPASVTSFGSYVFRDCTALESVTLSEGMTTLGYSMFSGCSSLAGVTLPHSLTTVPYMAFSGCTALTEITFPVQVSTLGNSAFQNCTALKNIYFLGDPPAINGNAFTGVNARAYYPYYNENWTEDMQQACTAGCTRPQPRPAKTAATRTIGSVVARAMNTMLSANRTVPGTKSAFGLILSEMGPPIGRAASVAMEFTMKNMLMFAILYCSAKVTM